ncbi:MAG: CDP-glycerol glycerophosphotransferase family protein [Candidatus Auribacterota bacterium]|nr:CDP-glycerol glycerophosphotransferase family protein [Candidatus Auribacterota bacterium]
MTEYSLRIIFYYIRCDLIYILSHLIPAKKNLWVFGSWFGEKYWGNARYFFEYVSQYCPDIKAVWLTRDDRVREYVSSKGYAVYDSYSLKGIWLSMRAGCCIITHNLYDVNEYATVTRKTKVVQLRRGTPFRTVPDCDEIIQSKLSCPRTIPLFKRYLYNWPRAMVIATSDNVAKVYTDHFRVPIKDVVVTGYPRNDQFFKGVDFSDPLLKMIAPHIKKYSKTGIFMPHDDAGHFFAKLKDINRQLQTIDTLLLVKPYQETERYLSLRSQSNIFFIKESDCIGDIYPLLMMTDFLITDYASVFFDYLLLVKPVLFVPFEIQPEQIGFFYNYDEVTPGPKAKNWRETIEHISALTRDQSVYAQQYEQVCRTFNEVRDATACQRVYMAVCSYCGLRPRKELTP